MSARIYKSAVELASELGLPLSWLKSEAKAGRIPSLQVGRRQLFNAEDVRQSLAERARNTTGKGAGDGQ